jgi:hypothetical protein
VAVLKISVFFNRPFWFWFWFWFFFCFIPMKIIQSLLVIKDGSIFWSSQTWQQFLTHAKHFEGGCIVKGTMNWIQNSNEGALSGWAIVSVNISAHATVLYVHKHWFLSSYHPMLFAWLK